MLTTRRALLLRNAYQTRRLRRASGLKILLMRIEGELSFREIASELGVPLGTALTWMRVATLKLKKMLGD